MTEEQRNLLLNAIQAVPDYPIEGVLFRDITTLLDNHQAYSLTIDLFTEQFCDKGITKIVGTEARGFLFGAPLALALGIGFVPVRKPGKLPRATISETYQLEYGQDTLEIHKDAVSEGDNVLIIDDLLATGGTILATTKLIKRLGAKVHSAAFVISLPDLGGEKRLEDSGVNVSSLLQYQGE